MYPERLYQQENGPATTRETLQMTLGSTNQTLCECESILREIDSKFHGGGQEIPLKDSMKEPPPSGINGYALTLRNQAQVLRDKLAKFCAELA